MSAINNDKTCSTCRFWAKEPSGYIEAAGIWHYSHECLNPVLKITGQHPAEVNHGGPPVSLADFGCNQWEAIHAAENINEAVLLGIADRMGEKFADLEKRAFLDGTSKHPHRTPIGFLRDQS